MPRQQSQKNSTSLQVIPRTNTVIHTPSSTMGQSIKDGIGLGVGSALAQRAVSAIFGPPTVTTVSQLPSEPNAPCISERNIFETCMRSQTVCNNEFLAYSQCIKLQQKEQ